MATLTTVYGANNTLRDQTVPPSKLDVTHEYGKIRRLYDSYTIASADEFGTSGLIKMMKIPAGARLIDARIIAPASGTTGQFEVGWAASSDGVEAADADGIFTTRDPGAAAVDARMSGTVPGYNKKFSSEVQVQIDVTEATQDAGEDVWQLELFIVVE